MSRPTALTPPEAFEAIQTLLDECGERLGKPQHVRDRMIERRVNDDDIIKVLRTGSISAAEWNDQHGNWRYPVCGLDLDGCPLVVVIALEPQFCRITVVTVKDSSS